MTDSRRGGLKSTSDLLTEVDDVSALMAMSCVDQEILLKRLKVYMEGSFEWGLAVGWYFIQ